MQGHHQDVSKTTVIMQEHQDVPTHNSVGGRNSFKNWE